MRYNIFMKFKYSLFASLLLIPTVTKAQTLQAYIPALIEFLGSTFISFLLGIAFLIFVINVVRFFIIESNNEEGRSKAKAVMTWSVIAFTLIIVFWGLVNIIGNSIFNDKSQPPSDYMCPNGLCPESMEPEWVPPIDNPCNNPYDPRCEPGLP